jgi:NRPS condensation-like uncharacterized protein
MAVSRAKRASNNKWDAEHMSVLSVKVKAEEAEAFRVYAKERGQTVNGLLAGYLRRCLAEDAATKQHHSE